MGRGENNNLIDSSSSSGFRGNNNLGSLNGPVPIDHFVTGKTKPVEITVDWISDWSRVSGKNEERPEDLNQAVATLLNDLESSPKDYIFSEWSLLHSTAIYENDNHGIVLQPNPESDVSPNVTNFRIVARAKADVDEGIKDYLRSPVSEDTFNLIEGHGKPLVDIKDIEFEVQAVDVEGNYVEDAITGKPIGERAFVPSKKNAKASFLSDLKENKRGYMYSGEINLELIEELLNEIKEQYPDKSSKDIIVGSVFNVGYGVDKSCRGIEIGFRE